MKTINNKGKINLEFITILAFILVIIAVVGFFASLNNYSRKYDVLRQNARDFASKVAMFRNEYSNYHKEIYLKDLVAVNYIKAFKNPFNGDKNCDLYESKVFFASDKERYVTLKCGEYIIYEQNVNSDEYDIYKVSDWQEDIDDIEFIQSTKLYNYKNSDGNMALSNFVTSRELIDLYNKNEQKDIKDLKEVDLSNVSIITKTYYRTKKLAK